MFCAIRESLPARREGNVVGSAARPNQYVDISGRCRYGIIMDHIGFAWDRRKAQENQRKHGVSFEEAQSAFHDPEARVMDDPDHSHEEERFLLLGMSRKLRILLVCHCYRQKDLQIRLISARKANRAEEAQYHRLGGRSEL